MTETPDLKPETLTAHGGRAPDAERGDVAPPLRPSTNYARDENYQQIGGQGGYARDESPSYPEVEALLARLEGGQGAMVFASGMAAATAIWLSLAPGDHVVLPKVIYWGLRDWLLKFADNWNLSVELFDQEDPGALARAVRPGKTKLVWVETPCNPTWDVIDIAAAAEAAHAAGALLAVDSTVATPVLTRPIALGADLVFHSATKYLGGHNDLLAGVVAGSADKIAPVREAVGVLGGILDPHAAWLLLRGLKTLAIRMERHNANALQLASWLEEQKLVRQVWYPGLPSHPDHETARRLMKGFGGVVTFEFSALAGERAASTRIRLAGTQDVIAVARMEDGSFAMAKRQIKVTIGGCGG